MTSDSPNNYYVFVNREDKELIVDEEGRYAFWNSLEEIIEVARSIKEDTPSFDFSKYGVALVTKTYTEFAPGNELVFYNIDVVRGFK